MKNTLMLSLGVSLLTIGANTTQAATAITYTTAPAVFNPGTWFAGFKFTTSTTIYVTDLGVMDIDGGGLPSDSNIGIYNATTGVRLADKKVLTSTTAEVTGANNSYFASIPELTLAAGSYIIAAETTGIAGNNTNAVFGPSITFDGGRATNVASGAMLAATNPLDAKDGFNQSFGSSFTGGTFKYSLTSVPEPSSTALLGLSGLALILRRRK